MDKPKMTSVILENDVRRMIDTIGASKGLPMNRTIEEAVKYYYFTADRTGLGERLASFVKAYEQIDRGAERLAGLYESPESLYHNGQDIKCGRVIASLASGINPVEQPSLFMEAASLQSALNNFGAVNWR